LEQARVSVEQIRAEVQQAFADNNLSPEEPFLENLTIGQYLDLPDQKRAKLWGEWGKVDFEAMEEREI